MHTTAFLHIQSISVLTSPQEDLLKPEISDENIQYKMEQGF